MSNKTIKDKSGARGPSSSEFTNEELAVRNLTGLNDDRNPFDLSAKYIVGKSEAVVDGSSRVNNCYVVLGRDRQSSRSTGYNAKGSTDCGMIDIVVGRHTNPGEEDENYCNIDFRRDAARIYISQKTDIDDYLGLAHRSHESVGLSGIGVKADEVRIVGRRNIKLHATTDPYDSRGPEHGPVNSIGGIYLIAGNRSNEDWFSDPDDPLPEIQPLVKGWTLNVLLSEIIESNKKNAQLLENYTQHALSVWNVIAQHEHNSPFYFDKTSPSSEATKQLPFEMVKVARETVREASDFQEKMTNMKLNWGLYIPGITGKNDEATRRKIYATKTGYWPHLSNHNKTN